MTKRWNESVYMGTVLALHCPTSQDMLTESQGILKSSISLLFNPRVFLRDNLDR